MKIRFFIIVFLVGAAAAGAQKPKPFGTVDLGAVATSGVACAARWKPITNQLLWIDQDHVAIERLEYCSDTATKSRMSSEVLIVDPNGKVNSIRLDDIFGPLRGPAGTLLIGHRNQVDLFDVDLRSRQSIRCPIAEEGCAAFVPSLSSDDSDFALCSMSTSLETCRFYRGFPAEGIVERDVSIAITNGFPQVPYGSIPSLEAGKMSLREGSMWSVSSSERWYFDPKHVLTSLKGDGSTDPVVTEVWTPKDSYCMGDVSTFEPRRFLATCIGTHFYTDGDLDSIFGYSRIVLFDVESHRILARIDGRAHTSSALSPDGKVIAVLHGDNVKFYRVS